MTTTQIIIAVCSFSVCIAVALIVYIWTDAKRSIGEAVTEDRCQERRDGEKAALESLGNKLRKHDHSEDGKVRVNL